CLPKDLPEFLSVDLSNLGMGDSVHLSDIKLPEGVAITSLSHGGGDLAVASVVAIKEEVEVAPVAAAEAVPGAEGAAAPAAGAAPGAAGAAAPAAAAGDAKKGEAPKADAKKPEAGKK
ncbi:MAG TPA: hypothetical protein VJS66_03995, partial [Burkholderiales bacterium]|nr:hypothetical protein [Burkholderiales bacterium]